jgi:hypothetical protein
VTRMEERPSALAAAARLSAFLTMVLALAPIPTARAGTGLIQFTVDPGPSAPSPPKVRQVASKASSIPAGSELCGIDSIFIDGYEGTVPPLTAFPGGLTSPGVSQSISGPPTFSVTISDPVNGASLPGNSTPVVGTFSGPTNTGIVINGQVAYVSGNQFLALSVPIANVSTPLTATATKMTGEVATFSASVTGGGTVSPVSLTIGPAAGYASFSANFGYSIGSLTNNGVATYVGIDANGDGIDDIVNPTNSTPLVYLQKQPGLYHAKLTVRDNNNVTYTSYVYYLVRSASELNGMLCDVYGYMRQQLTAAGGPYVTNALYSIHPSSQADYQTLFNNAGSGLPAYVTNLGSIVSGTISNDFASYLVVRQNADQTRSGYHMEFTQDAAGVWRIGDM